MSWSHNCATAARHSSRSKIGTAPGPQVMLPVSDNAQTDAGRNEPGGVNWANHRIENTNQHVTNEMGAKKERKGRAHSIPRRGGDTKQTNRKQATSSLTRGQSCRTVVEDWAGDEVFIA